MSELAREELRRAALQRPAALTIGNFDGVHRGHQLLVRHLLEQAHALDLAAVVVTLYPDPVRVLRPDEPHQYLTSLEERLDLLRATGLDAVVPLSFTSELAELSPDAFVRLLREEMDMRLLIMGPDNTFGRNRTATPGWMTTLGESLGFDVELLTLPLSAEGESVSATRIRAALAAGDLDTVKQQLGRPYSIRGPVVRGDQRGRLLDFPTANVALTADRALPALGVYAAWAYLGETRYAAATNVGKRPTFDGERTTIECHILDFDGDIYGQTLRVELVTRLRSEQKFGGVEELKAQIAKDVAAARTILAAGA